MDQLELSLILQLILLCIYLTTYITTNLMTMPKCGNEAQCQTYYSNLLMKMLYDIGGGKKSSLCDKVIESCHPVGTEGDYEVGR